jgi:hypothetical protein
MPLKTTRSQPMERCFRTLQLSPSSKVSFIVLGVPGMTRRLQELREADGPGVLRSAGRSATHDRTLVPMRGDDQLPDRTGCSRVHRQRGASFRGLLRGVGVPSPAGILPRAAAILREARALKQIRIAVRRKSRFSELVRSPTFGRLELGRSTARAPAAAVDLVDGGSNEAGVRAVRRARRDSLRAWRKNASRSGRRLPLPEPLKNSVGVSIAGCL